MKTRLTPHYISLFYEACLKSFWRKKSLSKFLRQSRVSEQFLNSWAPGETKRDLLDRLIDRLQTTDNGRKALLDMSLFLMEQSTFPDLQNWEDSEQKIKAAHDAVSKLRVFHSNQQDELQSYEDRARARKDFAKRQQEVTRSQQSIQKLNERLNELGKSLGDQKAGYEFQDWFYELLDFSEIENRRPSKIAVYDNCAVCLPPNNGLLFCNDDTCGVQSSLDFVGVNGQSYLIRVGSSPGEPGGSGMLAIQCLGFGAGTDDCSDAQSSSVIAGEGTFFFDTTTATTVGPDHDACDFFAQAGIDHDVWFCWTALCDGDVTIETCGQTFIDTKIAVYNDCTTCPPTDAGLLACNDDEIGCGVQSRVTISATNANSYLIRLGTYPGTAGGFATFSITCAGP